MSASPAARARALATCLERIATLDPQIRAWVQVSPTTSTADGPLAGIPFGAKDIIETRGLATEYGSSIYRGRVGEDDAAIVGELKGLGAILLGKTQTTAFACMTPAPTRNPRNLDHTPGGSSSGSAAAVAAGMVPFALGTQTKGSILRPASYCGVTGFKPTYGSFSMQGILPVAPSLDTLGFFTHTPADMLALWTAMQRETGGADEVVVGVPDEMPKADPVMTAAFERSLRLLRRAGVDVRSVYVGDMLARLADANHAVMLYEGARVHRERYTQYGNRLADVADLVRDGLRIPEAQYDAAKRYIDQCRLKTAELYRSTPVILMPAATGPAPAGLGWTGDPRMNAPWSALGTPALSIPMRVDDLPLGLQFTAARSHDEWLLRTAVTLHAILHGR
jgi:Asp-tRNA(Asn)/Glu-tRNA(Gln) amidotransferase A subunit family amidase